MPLSISRLVHLKGSGMAKARKKHPWFKIKGYLHFDFALTQREAEQYVSNSDNILRHRFSPLIHYVKKSRKVQRDVAAEKAYKSGVTAGKKPKLIVKEKPRKIFYSSHIDGYIYSYYGHSLQAHYDRFIAAENIADNVIAYRAVEKNGIKFCNTHFANAAFDFVRTTSGCHILCFDLSKFFDKLCPIILKANWQKIIGETQLPPDQFAVYQSLVKFRFVEESELIAAFKPRFSENPRKHGLPKEAGGSLKNRICDYKELRATASTTSEKLIKPKESLDITGIAQGTALSGLMSNIFMLEFDIAAKQHIESLGGCYKRYSDDIFIAVPTNISFESIEAKITQFLLMHCSGSVKLNADKTEQKIYQKDDSGKASIVDAVKQTPSKVQYLGFHFDGENVHIRNSSISKDRAKTVQLISKNKKSNRSIDTREVYKQRSHRKITPHNATNDKGFVSYATRAARDHGASESILDQVRKNDRFIKRALKRARPKKSFAE